MEERGLGKGLTVAPYPGTGDPEPSLVCCSPPWAQALSPPLGEAQGAACSWWNSRPHPAVCRPRGLRHSPSGLHRPTQSRPRCEAPLWEDRLLLRLASESRQAQSH